MPLLSLYHNIRGARPAGCTSPTPGPVGTDHSTHLTGPRVNLIQGQPPFHCISRRLKQLCSLNAAVELACPHLHTEPCMTRGRGAISSGSATHQERGPISSQNAGYSPTVFLCNRLYFIHAS